MNKIKRFLVTNWKPKYICLGIAIILWLGVRYGYLNQENDSPSQYGEIILSTP